MLENDYQKVKKEIISTLVNFSLFNHPPSFLELYQFLALKISLDFFKNSLEKLIEEGFLIENNGFYFLKENDSEILDLIQLRLEKFNHFKRKIKKAKKFTKIISFFPGIQAVFASNIIGNHNLRNESDIDLLIIASPKRLWTTRFLSVLTAKFLGWRPTAEDKKDKICLSFYLGADNLNLSKYLYNQADFYFKYWLAGLEPLFYRPGFLDLFWQKNSWILDCLPNLSLKIKTEIKDDLNLKKLFRKRPVSNYLEKILKQFQLRIMPLVLKEQLGKSPGVLLEDDIIKLFLKDQRSFFITSAQKKIEKILLDN